MKGGGRPDLIIGGQATQDNNARLSGPRSTENTKGPAAGQDAAAAGGSTGRVRRRTKAALKSEQKKGFPPGPPQAPVGIPPSKGQPHNSEADRKGWD